MTVRVAGKSGKPGGKTNGRGGWLGRTGVMRDGQRRRADGWRLRPAPDALRPGLEGGVVRSPGGVHGANEAGEALAGLAPGLHLGAVVVGGVVVVPAEHLLVAPHGEPVEVPASEVTGPVGDTHLLRQALPRGGPGAVDEVVVLVSVVERVEHVVPHPDLGIRADRIDEVGALLDVVGEQLTGRL